MSAYRNGIALSLSTPPSTFGVLTVNDLWFGALNSAGTPVFGSGSNQIGFGCVGASLTPAQEAAQYANVQAWATAIGAQV